MMAKVRLGKGGTGEGEILPGDTPSVFQVAPASNSKPGEPPSPITVPSPPPERMRLWTDIPNEHHNMSENLCLTLSSPTNQFPDTQPYHILLTFPMTYSFFVLVMLFLGRQKKKKKQPNKIDQYLRYPVLSPNIHISALFQNKIKISILSGKGLECPILSSLSNFVFHSCFVTQYSAFTAEQHLSISVKLG